MSAQRNERNVKTRLDSDQSGQHYPNMRRRHKRSVKRSRLPQGTLEIEWVEEQIAHEESSDDGDVEDEDYAPSRRASRQEKGKAATKPSETTRDAPEIEEENEEEVFDVEEIIPQNCMHLGTLHLRRPQNPKWREKVCYKGETNVVREMRAVDPRPLRKEETDYRFHTLFQQDFYESVIIPKTKPVAISQWIDWAYMESKNDPIFNQIVTACKEKHQREMMAFHKDWNIEIIAQFFATLYVEENGNTRKFHWMTEGSWYEVSYAQFARLLGFGRNDANRPKLHIHTRLDTRKMKFMYPRGKHGLVGQIKDMLPYYAYINRLFRKTITPREGDSSKIPSYNRNVLAAMAPNGLKFSVFDFIWEEIKSIANNPLKSCGYAPYIQHMIERVTGCTCVCDQEHHPLRIKNDLENPVEGNDATYGATPSMGASGSGQQGNKPLSPMRKLLNLTFFLTKCQYEADERAHHERQERKKLTKKIKETHTAIGIDAPCSPISSEVEVSDMETWDARKARIEKEDYCTQWYGDEEEGAFGPPHGESPTRDEEDNIDDDA